MYYDKEDNILECPKCKRMITPYDVKHGRCVVCDLDISAIGKDLSMIQEETLLETFANEIKKSDRKIDYYGTAINILKAYLVNTVCVVREIRTTFFYVEDCEIKDVMFRLCDRKKMIHMEFNYVPGYRGIKRYPTDIIKSCNLGAIKSYYQTTNFEKMMDIAMSIYNSKKKKCVKNSSKISLYRFR